MLSLYNYFLNIEFNKNISNTYSHTFQSTAINNEVNAIGNCFNIEWSISQQTLNNDTLIVGTYNNIYNICTLYSCVYIK